MDEEPKPAPGAEPIADYRRPPRGVFSQHAQRWLFLGISAAVIVTILLFGPEPPKTTDAEKPMDRAAETAPPSPQDDVDQRLAELEQQIKDSMRSIPRSSPPDLPSRESTTFSTPDLTGLTDPGMSDTLADRLRELEVTSLFASNVALTYREESNYGDSLRSTSLLGRTSGTPDEGAYPPYAFPPRPSFPIPPDFGPQPGAVAPAPVHETPAPPTGEGPAADKSDAAGPRLPLTQKSRDAPGSRLYTIFEGTVIESALVNRLDSSFAGPIITMVTNDAYSHDRQHVLIPAGTKCIGRTAAVESLGQTRMAVSFHRLIMPDGYSVDLDQFEGLNQLGDTGLKDKVDHHYFQIFGVSIALGFLGAISQRELEEPFDSAGPQFARSAAQVLDRFLNILPTVTIREGHRVKVYLTQDLGLPAYDDHGGIRP